MKKFRQLSEMLTPSSKPEPGREAVGGRFTSGAPKRPMKPAPLVTSEENISEIVMPQVKSDLGSLDKISFVKKHGITKTAAKEKVAEAKEVGDIPSGNESPSNLTVKKGKTIAFGSVTEATSAAVRLQRALQREKEKRERSERAGAALLNPKKPEPVKEEVMQEREDDEYHTPTRHHVQVQVSKGDGPKQHRKATVRAKEPQHAVSAAIAHYKQQGYTVHDHKYLGEEVESIEEMDKSQKGPPGWNISDDDTPHTPRIRMSKKDREELKKDPAGHLSKLFAKEYAKKKMKEEVEQIDEGRPSQRHPLEGHEYHKKSDEALIHIAKDAHAAAEAMKGHNTTAENKYRDQANDSATVRHYRKTHGMADWYKKKYGHVNEQKTSTEVPFDGPYTTRPSTVTDKSGAKHTPMSRARDLARQATKRQAGKLPVKESLEESRKAEIVKEIMKKGKKDNENKFQAEPELGTTVVKADN